MPYVIERKGTQYAVKNQNTGKYSAYGTTLKNAKAQVRLLEMLERKK